jgi:circadian clock protein KaiB
MIAPQHAAPNPSDDDLRGLEDIWYDLTLYVNGASEISAHAIADTRRLCDSRLGDRYKLTVVDIQQDPAAVRASGVHAAPTLVKNRPLPVRKHVGDMSKAAKVLLALDLPANQFHPKRRT